MLLLALDRYLHASDNPLGIVRLRLCFRLVAKRGIGRPAKVARGLAGRHIGRNQEVRREGTERCRCRPSAAASAPTPSCSPPITRMVAPPISSSRGTAA